MFEFFHDSGNWLFLDVMAASSLVITSFSNVAVESVLIGSRAIRYIPQNSNMQFDDCGYNIPLVDSNNQLETIISSLLE